MGRCAWRAGDRLRGSAISWGCRGLGIRYFGRGPPPSPICLVISSGIALHGELPAVHVVSCGASGWNTPLGSSVLLTWLSAAFFWQTIVQGFGISFRASQLSCHGLARRHLLPNLHPAYPSPVAVLSASWVAIGGFGHRSWAGAGNGGHRCETKLGACPQASTTPGNSGRACSALGDGRQPRRLEGFKPIVIAACMFRATGAVLAGCPTAIRESSLG